MDISSLRQEYAATGITKDSLDPNPFKQFEIWFKQAFDSGIVEPNAMSLTTVSETEQPSVRTVLLKGYDEDGFIFYTNYGSQKAQDIGSNAKVAALFPWLALERQIIIQGTQDNLIDNLTIWMSQGDCFTAGIDFEIRPAECLLFLGKYSVDSPVSTIVTGLPESSELEWTLRELGVSQILSKPFSGIQLEKTCRYILEKFGLISC